MSGDGRLDLDELGDVIDHASTLDAPARTEVLDDGRGRTWGERLEDAGVTPWLRRHRVAIASTTAVVVVAGAGVVAYRTLVPPPFDPEMRVGVSPVLPSQYQSGGSAQFFDRIAIFNTGPTLRSAYSLTRLDPSDTSTYSIVGLSGPGVRASSGSPQPSQTGLVPPQVARDDVDVVADCFDPSVLGSAPEDFALVVARTDDRGRILTRAVPLPAGDPAWGPFLTSTCLQTQAQFGLVPQSVDVSIDRPAHAVNADFVVSNALGQPTSVAMGPLYGVSQVVTTMRPTTLAARRGAVLPLRFEVRDCAAPTLPFISQPSFPGFQSYDTGGPGVFLSLTFPPDLIDPQNDPTGVGGQVQAPVLFSPDQAREINDAMQSMCDAAPSATIRVRDVGRASQVTGVFLSGNAQSTRFPVTLSVVVAGADRLTVTSPTQPEDAQQTRVAPASTPVADGRATLRTWIDIDCQIGYASPPIAQLEVTTPRGVFPLQVQVNDANLTEAVAATCVELPLQSLLDYGWAASA